MAITRTLLLVAGLLGGTSAAALAQAPMQQVRSACAADMQRHCAGVQPGGGRILACFRQHQAELSPACREALAAARAARANAQ
ncbi:cysteine rich repeat-containing protein [Zavarzinia sp. CC-PAN008]|uniref:cysteine rich repeat-containing protein n=1 Tax=Zavarzinia sp. CC-PAN008 TaxID=3243332 RepID=UPI003F7498B6